MTSMQDPFDDLTNGDRPDELLDGELVDETELADAERFAEILDRMDAGGGVDLDPREDPTLAALTTVAAQLQDSARDATSTPRFESYRARSRDYLLGRIERERAAVAASAQPAVEPAREESSGLFGVPFLRWNVLAPVASAAAAAVAVLAFVVATDGGAATPVEPQTAALVDPPAAQPVASDGDEQDAVEPAEPREVVRYEYIILTASDEPSTEALFDQFATAIEVRQQEPPDEIADETEVAPQTVTALPQPEPVASNAQQVSATQRPTPRTVPEQLDHIETLLSELTVKVEQQERVPGRLLREITESIAAVAYRIEASPDQVTHAQVVAYIHAAADGRFLLAAAVTDEADEAALSAARRVAQDGVVVAGWYLTYR